MAESYQMGCLVDFFIESARPVVDYDGKLLIGEGGDNDLSDL